MSYFRSCIYSGPSSANIDLLCMNSTVPSNLPNDYVSADIDVTPFDSSKFHKENYLINAELREKPQKRSYFSLIIRGSEN